MPVTDVTTDADNLTMTVVADFAAPIEGVWSAYSDPRQLERFWGPPGWPATFTAWDHTVGGRAVYSMNGPRGEKSSGSWEFLSIEGTELLRSDRLLRRRVRQAAGGLPRAADVVLVRAHRRGHPHGHDEPLRLGRCTRAGRRDGPGRGEGIKMAMAQLDAVLQDLREYAQGKGTRVELLDDTHVRITRLVEGPRELVWRAHFEPELIRKWMLGPDGWEMTECVAATEVGQSYRNSWAPVGDTEGEPFGFEGEALPDRRPRAERSPPSGCRACRPRPSTT